MLDAGFSMLDTRWSMLDGRYRKMDIQEISDGEIRKDIGYSETDIRYLPGPAGIFTGTI
jgi:hypothetical protein